MHEPQMQSPLHGLGLAPRAKPFVDSIGVWANELPLLGYISLRGDAQDSNFVETVATALGTALPLQPCTLTHSGSTKALWLSPDEWMIVCPRRDRDLILSKLASALSGQRHQVIDNSGGFTQILLKGHCATTVLAHVSAYDISALRQGRVVGTTIGKSTAYLHRQCDGYCLLLRRSFADYIWRFLARAAMPYGFEILKVSDDVSNGVVG